MNTQEMISFFRENGISEEKINRFLANLNNVQLGKDGSGSLNPAGAVPIYVPNGCGTSPQAIFTYNMLANIIQCVGMEFANLLISALIPPAVEAELNKQIGETMHTLKQMQSEGRADITTMNSLLTQCSTILETIKAVQNEINKTQNTINTQAETIAAQTEQNSSIKNTIDIINNQIDEKQRRIENIKNECETLLNTAQDLYKNIFEPKYNQVVDMHHDVKVWHEQIFGKLEGNLAEAERLIRELEGLNPDADRVLGELRPLVEAGLALEEEIKNARQSVENKGLEEISKLDAKGAETLTRLDVAKTDALQSIDAGKTDIETIIGEGRTALEAKEQEALQGIGAKERDALQNIGDKEQEITSAGAEAVENIAKKEITAKEAVELLAESERRSLLNLLTASTLKAQNPGGLLPPVPQPFVLGYGSFEIENEAYKLLPSKDDTVEGMLEFTNGGALTLQTQALTDSKTWEAGQIIKLSVPINLVVNSADIENIEVTAALAVKNGAETRFSLAKNFTLAPGNEVRIFPFEISSETSLETGDIIAFGLSFPQITVIGRIPLGSKIRPTELIEMKTAPVTETGTQNILNALAAGLAKTDVEVGSNGNGSYVKFANGLLICYKPFFATNFRSGNSYAGTDWVFPHAFKGTFYSVSASGTGGVGDWARSHIYLHDETRTSTRCPIWVASKLNDTTSGFTQLSVLAAGFWK